MFRNVPCSGFYRRPFPSAKLKMAVAAVKVIWVPSDDGAVVIPLIMEIHTDFLGPFQTLQLTLDMTLTRPNQMLRD